MLLGTRRSRLSRPHRRILSSGGDGCGGHKSSLSSPSPPPSSSSGRGDVYPNKPTTSDVSVGRGYGSGLLPPLYLPKDAYARRLENMSLTSATSADDSYGSCSFEDDICHPSLGRMHSGSEETSNVESSVQSSILSGRAASRIKSGRESSQRSNCAPEPCDDEGEEESLPSSTVRGPREDSPTVSDAAAYEEGPSRLPYPSSSTPRLPPAVLKYMKRCARKSEAPVENNDNVAISNDTRRNLARKGPQATLAVAATTKMAKDASATESKNAKREGARQRSAIMEDGPKGDETADVPMATGSAAPTRCAPSAGVGRIRHRSPGAKSMLLSKSKNGTTDPSSLVSSEIAALGRGGTPLPGSSATAPATAAVAAEAVENMTSAAKALDATNALETASKGKQKKGTASGRVAVMRRQKKVKALVLARKEQKEKTLAEARERTRQEEEEREWLILMKTMMKQQRRRREGGELGRREEEKRADRQIQELEQAKTQLAHCSKGERLTCNTNKYNEKRTVEQQPRQQTERGPERRHAQDPARREQSGEAEKDRKEESEQRRKIRELQQQQHEPALRQEEQPETDRSAEENGVSCASEADDGRPGRTFMGFAERLLAEIASGSAYGPDGDDPYSLSSPSDEAPTGLSEFVRETGSGGDFIGGDPNLPKPILRRFPTPRTRGAHCLRTRRHNRVGFESVRPLSLERSNALLDDDDSSYDSGTSDRREERWEGGHGVGDRRNLVAKFDQDIEAALSQRHDGGSHYCPQLVAATTVTVSRLLSGEEEELFAAESADNSERASS